MHKIWNNSKAREWIKNLYSQVDTKFIWPINDNNAKVIHFADAGVDMK